MSVERALAQLGRIESRSAYPYTSTWPLEEVELTCAGGETLRVLVKRLEGPRVSKPAWLCDPEREIEAYRLLAGEALGTARCYASGRRWLILEKLNGRELWQHGELDAWAATASWASTLHERFVADPPSTSMLLRHDERLHRRLLDLALQSTDGPRTWLERAGACAIARLAALPVTLIHGELYPSNVLVDANGRVSAVDWETAAIGPGAIDLAALLTGWEGTPREAIRAAYGEIEPLDLAAAELVLALQWVGFAPKRQPPPEHRHDWLAQAHAAAELLL